MMNNQRHYCLLQDVSRPKGSVLCDWNDLFYVTEMTYSYDQEGLFYVTGMACSMWPRRPVLCG